MSDGMGWWNRMGFLAGANSARDELAKRDMNIAIYDVPKYGVTMVMARGQRALDVRERLADLFEKDDA